MYGDFILLSRAGEPLRRWQRLSLGTTSGRNEAWLRDTLFAHPELLPLNDIDPAFGPLAPLCTELQTGAGPIDAAFINPDGRLTIVETKLWRNPQARREVVAQILDYARALTRWSYSDLQRQVTARTGQQGNVPFESARAVRPEISEPTFIDAAARALRNGRFLLLIVGDGVREDVEAIAELINRNAASAFQLAVIEAALYDAGDGAIVIQPRVLARTRLIERTVTIIADPVPTVETRFVLASDDDASAPEPIARTTSKTHDEYRSWWQPILDMTFDDPDQTPPVLYWPNNVRIRLPWPKLTITAYRAHTGSRAEAGVFLSGPPDQLDAFWSALGDETRLLEELPEAQINTDKDGRRFVGERRLVADFPGDSALQSWLIDRLNAFANALRPRIKALRNPDVLRG